MCFAIPIPRNTLNPASVHLACSQRDYSLLPQPCTLHPPPAPERGRSRTLPSLPLDLTLQTPSSSPRHHVPSQAPRHHSPHESHRSSRDGNQSRMGPLPNTEAETDHASALSAPHGTMVSNQILYSLKNQTPQKNLAGTSMQGKLSQLLCPIITGTADQIPAAVCSTCILKVFSPTFWCILLTRDIK